MADDRFFSRAHNRKRDMFGGKPFVPDCRVASSGRVLQAGFFTISFAACSKIRFKLQMKYRGLGITLF